MQQRRFIAAAVALLAGPWAMAQSPPSETLDWPQVLARFRQNNPGLSAGELNIHESQANELTAGVRPNPTFTSTEDQNNFFNISPFRPFASVQYVDTIPPEIRKAIADRHPTVGMDREQVVAALGKPNRKVRERDANGIDIEDWIYGNPPDKTIFVRFTGDRVTGIKQYPQ